MSELINTHDNRATIRWKLLTGASALALTAYVSSTGLARADDTDRPTIWIELGGDMQMMQGLSKPFVPPFLLVTPTPSPYLIDSPIALQRPPRDAMGIDGKITFQPEDSDWIFSAGIRYGRSHSRRHVHHETALPSVSFDNCFTYYGYSYCYSGTLAVGQKLLSDVKVTNSEKHVVMDFSAGKDVGLGLLGPGGTSIVSAGVRLARFVMKSHVDIHAIPSVAIGYPTQFHVYPYVTAIQHYTMHAGASREFNGVGPSLSWAGSAVLAGNPQAGELMLDWGVDAALLFGKQKAKIDHTTRDVIEGRVGGAIPTFTSTVPHHDTRSRSVTVPNVGGSLGFSVKYPNFKVSLGYRYDTFLNAMDVGIDARKTSNLTFNGPYASISIGLGD